MSSRDLAKVCGLARSNVVLALDSLAAKVLIAVRQGTPKKPAVYQLNLFKTQVFASSSGGLTIGPPVVSGKHHGGLTVGPPPHRQLSANPRIPLWPKNCFSIDPDQQYLQLVAIDRG